MKDTAALAVAAKELTGEFTALSDSIWDEPELRWQEEKSVSKQISVAQAHGFTIERGVGGVPTAFMASRGSGGPVIAILGEYDSLAGLSQESGVAERRPDPANDSGNGQGCGHNLLGTGSLMAAVLAADHLEREGLPGTIRYYGCPAEEAAAGKSFMVRNGAFDGVDAAVSWHPSSVMTVNQMLSLAYTQVYFEFTGVAAHAGASPHLGRSALDAAELLNIGVNFLREHMADTSRIHYAFTDAGGESPNVVQSTARLYYIVRAKTVAEMQALYERVVRVAQGAALMTDVELTIEFDGASAELLPNAALEGVMQPNVEAIGPVPFDEQDQQAAARFAATVSPEEIAAARALASIPDDDTTLDTSISPLSPPTHRFQMTGSTDVGDVSWIVPTVQLAGATCAIGTPAHSWQMVAQGKMPAAHKGMIHAAQVMAATAVDMASDTAVLPNARQEFQGIIATTPYLCPIPDDVDVPPLRHRAAQASTADL